MIEVADLEAQGLIKKLEAAYTWPHHGEAGYHTAAVFVRTEDDTPYLIYCPKLRVEIAINEQSYHSLGFWWEESIKKLELQQGLFQVDGVLFLIIELKTHEPAKVKKEEIEKLFDIKVV